MQCRSAVEEECMTLPDCNTDLRDYEDYRIN